MTTKYEIHPIADIFPIGTEKELLELGESIQQNGQRLPITLYEGKILDGRRRYTACLKFHLEPVFESPVITDPIKFVWDRNLRFRYLNLRQKAELARKLKNLKLGRPGKEIGSKEPILNSDSVTTSEKQPPISQEHAAEIMGVGRSSVSKLTYVEKHAEPEVKQALKEDKIKLTTASAIAKQPKTEQGKALKAALSPKRIKRKPKPFIPKILERSPQQVREDVWERMLGITCHWVNSREGVLECLHYLQEKIALAIEVFPQTTRNGELLLLTLNSKSEKENYNQRHRFDKIEVE